MCVKPRLFFATSAKLIRGSKMAVDSEALLDWLVCCRAKEYALQFLAGGCNNVEDVTKMTEEEFKKLGVPTYLCAYSREVRKLHDRTRTREELSRELLVSVLHE